MTNERPKTIITDLDGCIFEHTGSICDLPIVKPKLLPGVLDKWQEWDRAGFKIVIITGRRESTRKDTERQLRESGIFYDELIMGMSSGDRILINDKKPDNDKDTAFSINLIRNEGMNKVKI